ncbi:hypothetical protein [Micromonospora sp. CPCC 206061]|uniref:hypothetical protein n=1 Tax=Micromonospora sp. CPCC 206061 TaxID=3122410 RepID=UPI002FEFB93B
MPPELSAAVPRTRSGSSPPKATAIVIYSNACDITAVVNQLAAEGHPVDPEDLALHHRAHPPLRRLVLDLTPPDAEPDTRLELQPGALFPPGS